ncbi:hypothetical protein RSJ42_08490 [Methanosarcina hadiensis]
MGFNIQGLKIERKEELKKISEKSRYSSTGVIESMRLFYFPFIAFSQ